MVASTLDKQRICVNTQLKSSKKQLKLEHIRWRAIANPHALEEI